MKVPTLADLPLRIQQKKSVLCANNWGIDKLASKYP